MLLCALQPRGYNRAMLHKLFLTALLLLPAGCVFGGPPKGLALSTGAHPDHPVLVQSLTINGAELNRMESLKLSGWSGPKGAGHALLSMPVDAGDRSRLHLTAQWTDLAGNIGYSGQITAKMSDLTVVKLSDRTGEVIVLFGPDGYLELATAAPPDASGQYNGRIIATVCATAGPGLPADHWIWENGRYQGLDPVPAQAPDMGCRR